MEHPSMEHSSIVSFESQGVSYYGAPEPADVEFMIPVYNEESCLHNAVESLHEYLAERHNTTFSWRIVVIDNASTDSTWNIATELTAQHPQSIRAMHLQRKGRGLALKTAWMSSSAVVVAYMDADLSTSLEHIDDLVLPLLHHEADLAIGSRLMKESKTARSFLRDIISRCYNFLLRSYSGANFSDAQCGFKAVRADVFRALAPSIQDNEWFFDTELLLLAQNRGLQLNQIPVYWVEDPNSSVHIIDTARKDIQGMIRMRSRYGRGTIGALQKRAVRMESLRAPVFRGSLVPVRLLVPAV
ncbi:dolichyl-phosphate beta-glucosyltransferase [Alloscardovia omnicolens]|uniref:dolichyl-phosphate beta-glucosyltransferase n=1 Tax=Alloscardovia omnicolens TaxID=419015 RepID=UPI00290E0CB6|nr:glycosyltransferase family 2 protein [Alloscardovia omnicolens]